MGTIKRDELEEAIRNGEYQPVHRARPASESKEEFKLRMAEQRKSCYEVMTKLKEKVEEAFGLTNYPKRDAVWKKAWEDGHSESYLAVFWQYRELSELIVWTNVARME